MSIQRNYGALKEHEVVAARPRPKRVNFWALGVVVFCAIISAIFIGSEWFLAVQETEAATSVSFTPLAQSAKSSPAAPARAKPLAQTVKGLYLTAFSASSPKKLDSIINLVTSTELNAVVVDIKDYTGYVLYKSRVPLVKKFGTYKTIYKDLSGTVKKLHDHDIYVIARQTVFQDPILAEKKPDWAIRTATSGVWRDYKGLSWVDPTRREVWKYNMDIAREAIGFGFDEINFDYVRFPSDGDMTTATFTISGRPKYAVMHDFFDYLGESLKDETVWLSIDMFGLTMEATSTFDLNIGQRIVDATSSVDYICPMMYPSHYPRGHLGFKNPAEHPAEVFAYGLKAGAPKFVNQRARLRPWIQAFNLGAVYDGAKIRAQIDEIEKYTDAGWLVWNASNRYTNAGFKPEL